MTLRIEKSCVIMYEVKDHTVKELIHLTIRYIIKIS